MRAVWLLASVLAVCSASYCVAQTPASKPIHCSVQTPLPVTEADLAFSSGDFAGAEKQFAAQLGSSPNVANHAGLIKSQLEQNKLAEALSSAEKAQAALGQSAEAQNLLGDVYLRSARIPEALAAFKKALAIDPCSGQAHFGLGRNRRTQLGPRKRPHMSSTLRTS